jgi:hypothetical protein
VDGKDAEREIAANLDEALRLMNGERWRPVRERWMDELNDIAGKAQVELPVR